MKNFVSKSESDTLGLARKLAPFLQSGDVVVLSGDLGSGKTKFTQGILEHFGLEDEISSPTFTIVNEHHQNGVNIYHFDVYRLNGSDEFYAIGGDEYLEHGISVIEWGEQIEDVLPSEYLKISFEKDAQDENTRVLSFIPFGDRFENILYKLL